VAQAGAALVVVEVELWVLHAGAGAEVAGKPTAVVAAGAATADVVGRWGHDGTPFDTLEEHCRIELT
jgi:hypothetical protein